MNTRGFVAVVLSVAMLASFISVPAFAEGEGAICEELDILTGTDEDGITDEYLAKQQQELMFKSNLRGCHTAASFLNHKVLIIPGTISTFSLVLRKN